MCQLWARPAARHPVIPSTVAATACSSLSSCTAPTLVHEWPAPALSPAPAVTVLHLLSLPQANNIGCSKLVQLVTEAYKARRVWCGKHGSALPCNRTPLASTFFHMASHPVTFWPASSLAAAPQVAQAANQADAFTNGEPSPACACLFHLRTISGPAHSTLLPGRGW